MVRSSIFCLALLGVLACEEAPLAPLADPLEVYYPLELNQPTYFQVDSVILVRAVGGVRYDSSSTEARETLVETFVGGDGSTYYRGERWERRNESAPFQFKQTFTVHRDGSSLVRSEDNLTFTKLVSPLREGVNWDGNRGFDDSRQVFVGGELLDVYEGWNYRYLNTDTAVDLRTGLQVDSVVVVRQADVTDNLVEYRVAYEWYAPGIGLVERFVDARHSQCINTQSNCDELSWDEKADKGYIIRQTFLRRD
ncbi:hypothetical protein CLV84_2988 [Neolewinella xylanilytica]|uniref:Lipoprotein n=1 Tax=Neolewinella xylanilytica TaxID=1514080 RepID=A0A2S6I4Q1_9BACT|nr:hypothetical protein [Neolewinella xylanilytica]PPK86071.1 hypothetical protein CLV84_2988 [Neolewinella xylanilytica]